mgnify:CR=1 FL=1
MAKALKLTRDQLAKFLPDARAIRQFESMVDVSQSVEDGSLEEEILNAGKSFETVNNNLGAYPKAYSYTGDDLTQVSYTVSATETIIKTLTYSAGKLSEVVLSGDTPDGIDLTKTFIYSGDTLTNVSYS